VSTDPEHRFELAMATKNLALARDIALESDSQQKWKQLGDAALHMNFDLAMAQECFTRSKDLSALLLLHTSLCNKTGMVRCFPTVPSPHSVASPRCISPWF
jgi:coatomer subunit beta'